MYVTHKYNVTLKIINAAKFICPQLTKVISYNKYNRKLILKTHVHFFLADSSSAINNCRSAPVKKLNRTLKKKLEKDKLLKSFSISINNFINIYIYLFKIKVLEYINNLKVFRNNDRDPSDQVLLNFMFCFTFYFLRSAFLDHLFCCLSHFYFIFYMKLSNRSYISIFF